MKKNVVFICLFFTSALCFGQLSKTDLRNIVNQSFLYADTLFYSYYDIKKAMRERGLTFEFGSIGPYGQRVEKNAEGTYIINTDYYIISMWSENEIIGYQVIINFANHTTALLAGNDIYQFIAEYTGSMGRRVDQNTMVRWFPPYDNFILYIEQVTLHFTNSNTIVISFTGTDTL
jgi:hypothetical protein